MLQLTGRSPANLPGASGDDRPGGPVSFRQAMSRFASGVVIVSARDETGTPHGFTATAFTSVSADPPMVLACIDVGARCHRVFTQAASFAVDVLGLHHWPLAERFASKVDNKYRGEFAQDPQGLPWLPDSLAHFSCSVDQRLPAGDHTILVGRVCYVAVSEGEPAVYFDRGPRGLTPDGPTVAGR
jgi:flavin reductase ActVB